jgi:PilZ domain
MEEKRKEPRIAVMTRVEAMWEDETGAPRVAPATIEDRSPGGVSIRITTPISVGSKLTIKGHREEFSGVVVNSRNDKAEYFLGIKRDVAAKPNTKEESTK